MGLLDEAIREHLELKRRRGGDPSAIAREEREALAPGVADALADEGDGAAVHRPLDAGAASATAPVPATVHDHGDDRIADLSAGSQETAELDMQELMGEDPDAADPGSPEPPEVDPLEWELPGDRDRESPPREIPGQERLSFE